MGHLIQWAEDGDFDAATFCWKHLLVAARSDGLEVPNLHSAPGHPTRYSNLHVFKPDGRPRPATVVIRKIDGGPIGT